MSVIEASALAIVVLAALYLLALGVASLVVPSRARSFLLGFASTKPVHFAELVLRLVVGAALVSYAPRMSLPGVFNLVGWVLLVTTACLLLLPWRWHRRFAEHAVPQATRHIELLGAGSLGFGAMILAAVMRVGAS